jgi:hypothetical protein
VKPQVPLVQVALPLGTLQSRHEAPHAVGVFSGTHEVPHRFEPAGHTQRFEFMSQMRPPRQSALSRQPKTHVLLVPSQ